MLFFFESDFKDFWETFLIRGMSEYGLTEKFSLNFIFGERSRWKCIRVSGCWLCATFTWEPAACRADGGQLQNLMNSSFFGGVNFYHIENASPAMSSFDWHHFRDNRTLYYVVFALPHFGLKTDKKSQVLFCYVSFRSNFQLFDKKSSSGLDLRG